MNLIGNGVVIDPITLKMEIQILKDANVDYKDRLLVSKKAHLILPSHRLLDAASEHAKGKEKIGSTLKGIGPTYMDKTGRNGLRVGDLFEPDFEAKYQNNPDPHNRELAFEKMLKEVMLARRKDELELYKLFAGDSAFKASWTQSMQRSVGL